MIIHVKVLQGGEVSLEVSSEATVRDVKKAIEERMRITVIQQKLLFKGKTLSDHQKLKDLMIQDGSKLFLSVQSSSGGEDNKFWESLYLMLRKHFLHEDCVKIVSEMKRDMVHFVDNLNLDEIERIAVQWQDNKNAQPNAVLTA